MENEMGMEEMRNTKILVSKPKGKRPLGRPGSRREDNVRMYRREVWLKGEDWDQWRALMNTVMNIRVP